MEYLIPLDSFAGLASPWLLGIFLASVVVLVKGADLLVTGAANLAYRLGIGKIIVGATIVSIGTTTPECAVSVMAAWRGEPGLALGNAIGSIICDTAFVFGFCCLLARIPVDRFILNRHGWLQLSAGLLLTLVCVVPLFTGKDTAILGRFVGFGFLTLLAGYLWISVRWSKEHPYGEPFAIVNDEETERKHPGAARLVAFFLIGLGFVLLSSRVLIMSVTELAEAHWHVPKIVIAATLVALGTSFPELVIGITSILKGHREILVGNVIGADILNVLFVVGASAIAAPLPILEQGTALPAVALYVHVPAMLFVLLLFRVFIFSATSRGTFRRWNGVPLVALYVAYVVVQFVLTRPA